MAADPTDHEHEICPNPARRPRSARRREVFYAAYGSNLSAERFACYIAGGTAPGASRALPGARDSASPSRGAR